MSVFYCRTSILCVLILLWLVQELFAGKVPFHDRQHSCGMHIFGGGLPEFPDTATTFGLSDDVQRVIETCWTSEPLERPTIKDIATTLVSIQSERYVIVLLSPCLSDLAVVYTVQFRR